MAGQPKNKITRAEQGKRRHGNTPKLVKDTHLAKAPLHKRAYFDRLLQKLSGKATAQDSTTHKVKKAQKSQKAGIAPTTGEHQSALKSVASVKKTTRTQHKGG